MGKLYDNNKYHLPPKAPKGSPNDGWDKFVKKIDNKTISVLEAGLV